MFKKTNSIKALAWLLAAGSAMTLATSCTDQDFGLFDKGNTELALTASSEFVTLEEANHAQTAIDFKWTSGTNFGSGKRIYYTFELAEAGTDFADAYAIKESVTEAYNWTPKVDELNQVLLNSMLLEAGETYDLEARVIANVDGYDSQVSTVNFTVTTYKPVTETLFLIGSAAPNGWSADGAAPMKRKDNGVFSWTGNLNAGEFKFITTLGQFLPSYNNNGEGGLVYRSDDAEPDLKFDVTEAGYYRVDANLLDLTCTVTPVDGNAPKYDKLFFVGGVTGWSFWEMTVDPLDPFLFRIGVFFDGESEFKFGTASGSWENMFKATVPNAPYTDQSTEFISGFDPDNKWLMTAAEANKAYKICFDTRDGAERMICTLFEPYTTMYIVGDATPKGWDIGNATPMTVDPSDPNIFTWTGHLNTGELKFTADKKSDWMGAWFLATEENMALTPGVTQKVLFIDKSSADCKAQYLDIAVGDVDRKWKVTEAGTYTITLNQLTQEVTFTK